MAKTQDSSIRRTLRKLFPSRSVEKLAREAGAVQRQRKVDIVALFWTVVLGFAVQRKRSMAALRRAYEKTTGQTLEESSFYARFSERFARLLQQAIAYALDQGRTTGRRIKGALAAFRDVVVADATVLRLHDLLAKTYPGTRTNQGLAAAKLHVVLSVRGAGRQSVRLTGERIADGKVLVIGPWVQSKLLLFDLGYFKYQLFARIIQNGGYFVSRLKSTTNPQIVSTNRTHRGRALPVVGQCLKDLRPRLRRQVLDVEVHVHFYRRSYAGRRHRDTMTLRMVGVRHPHTRQHHFFLTNIPVDKLAAEDISAVYAARWQVELLFNQLKSSYHLDQLPSRKVHVVRSLVYASVLTLIVSQRLRAAILRRLRLESDRLPENRFAQVFAAAAQEILRILVSPPRHTFFLQHDVSRMLSHEAVDPNVHRPGLLEAIGTRQHRRQLNPLNAKQIQPPSCC